MSIEYTENFEVEHIQSIAEDFKVPQKPHHTFNECLVLQNAIGYLSDFNDNHIDEEDSQLTETIKRLCFIYRDLLDRDFMLGRREKTSAEEERIKKEEEQEEKERKEQWKKREVVND